MNTSQVLVVADLQANYGEKPALQDLSLSVGRGEILGLIGPNGAGKTTLIKVISGILQPQKGQIEVSGREITTLSNAERARALAVVPQAHQLGGAFTVEQAVMLGRTAYLGFLGRPAEQDLIRVRWAMEETAVDHLAQRKLAEISGGEQQRVLLARALAQDTPVLLLDEPTNHLDLRYQASLLQLLKSLVESQQLTVLVAMHDLNQVSGIADRVALLVAGRLRKAGLPDEVLTADVIQDAYQTDVEAFQHPRSRQNFIFPVA